MPPNPQTQPSTIGLLFLGRKRPGFDPDWGARMETNVRDAVDRAAFKVFEPSLKAVDDASLQQAIDECKSAKVDALVVLQTTMADGRMVPRLAQSWPQPPVFWATPEKQEGEMISSCSLVGAHLWASTFRQTGRSFDVFSGDPKDPDTIRRLETAVRIAATLGELSQARVGVIGGQAPGFVNMTPDPLTLRRAFGIQLQAYSLVEFDNVLNELSDDAVEADIAKVNALGIDYKDTSEDDLPMASRLYLTMRHFFDSETLDALAVRCWPEMPNTYGQWPYLGMARLAEQGRAIACEGDADGAIGAFIGERLGMGRCYLSDWLEHDETSITLWHVGAMPFSLSPEEGQPGSPKLAKHFNNQKPVVIESELRPEMPLTLFRLWRCDNAYHLAACDAASETPRPLMCSNGRARLLDRAPGEWFESLCHAGMPHHLNVFKGHHTQTLKRFAQVAGIQWHG